MTFVQGFKAAKTWQRKVVLVSLFHNIRLSKNKKWKLSDSAKYFHVSIGLISENLFLSQEWEVIKDCSSRNSALKLVRANNDNKKKKKE